MENPEATQLPEADSLPDGFVDSSADPLTPSEQEEDDVNDYKEERLVEVESRPDLVVDDFQSCDGDDGSIEQARTFPVELSELVEIDAQKECKDESGAGSPSFVPENVVNKDAQGTCQRSEKCNVFWLLAYMNLIYDVLPNQFVFEFSY